MGHDDAGSSRARGNRSDRLALGARAFIADPAINVRRLFVGTTLHETLDRHAAAVSRAGRKMVLAPF